MKTLLISGDTLQEWDIDNILDIKSQSTKQQAERIQLFNHFEKQRVREFYENCYMELEINKSI